MSASAVNTVLAQIFQTWKEKQNTIIMIKKILGAMIPHKSSVHTYHVVL